MDELWWPGPLHCTSFSKPRRKRSGWICDWKAEQAEITFGITKYRARVMVVGPGGHVPALFHGKHDQNLCKRHIAMWNIHISPTASTKREVALKSQQKVLISAVFHCKTKGLENLKVTILKPLKLGGSLSNFERLPPAQAMLLHNDAV